jgi:hypothetical protein
MKTLEDFTEKPWHKDSTHAIYESAFLHMRPAPEYASGEVVLASVYRNLGFKNVSEGKVPKFGRAFNKVLKAGKRPKDGSKSTGIDSDSWSGIVVSNLKSPKQPNQTAKRFLQVMPIVPDATIYSLSARLSANSWNPGELVNTILDFGTSSEKKAQAERKAIFEALTVDDSDDIWARFLQEEFESWRKPSDELGWKFSGDRKWSSAVEEWHEVESPCPAQQFTKDIGQIIRLKNLLTRRQWITMLESLARLGSASHVMWICNSNKNCFDLLSSALRGVKPAAGGFDGLMKSSQTLRYDQLAAKAINDLSIGFIYARAGINLLLWMLESKNLIPKDDAISLANSLKIDRLAEFVFENREKIDIAEFNAYLGAAMANNPREASGKKGVASNIKEFLRHVLGQRQTAEKGLDSYDQGYYLRKKGAYRTAPWVVSLGPVSVLTIVHALSGESTGPQTVENLCSHLNNYGIALEAQDVPMNALGKILRDLGLVLDSPDAEGGMVVVSPFNSGAPA